MHNQSRRTKGVCDVAMVDTYTGELICVEANMKIKVTTIIILQYTMQR